MNGCIYELRAYINKQWYPFYVGRTKNPAVRIRDHKYKTKSKDQHDVYKFTVQLEESNIEWDLFPVRNYSNGPGYLEAESMVECIKSGATLMNMKQGDRLDEDVLNDMKKRGIPSFKKYCSVIAKERTIEQKRKQQEQWLKDNKPSLKTRIKSKESFKRDEEAKIEKRKQVDIISASILNTIIR